MQSYSIFKTKNEDKVISKDELFKNIHELIDYLKDLFQLTIDMLEHDINSSKEYSTNAKVRSRVYREPEDEERLKYEDDYQVALAKLTQRDDSTILKLITEHPNSQSIKLHKLKQGYNAIYTTLEEIAVKGVFTQDEIEKLCRFRDAKFSNFKSAFNRMNDLIQIVRIELNRVNEQPNDPQFVDSQVVQFHGFDTV